MFKELYKRMHEYEARVGPLGDVRTVTLPSMIMIMADPSTKAHFLDRKSGQNPKVAGFRKVFKNKA